MGCRSIRRELTNTTTRGDPARPGRATLQGRRLSGARQKPPYRKWQVTRPWPPGDLWTPLKASRWLGARGRSTPARCAPRAPPRRADRGAPPPARPARASATASMRCSRRRLCSTTTGTSTATPTPAMAIASALTGITILDWRSGVKPGAGATGASDPEGDRRRVHPAKAGAFSGRQTSRGKSQSPVAWVTGRKETDDLKLTDKATGKGWLASHRAVTRVNAQVATKPSWPGGRVS